MAGIPRRHHFVTKAYLDGFLLPGEKHLCCYGRKKFAPFLTAPENLANRHDYYSFKRSDGTIDYSLETQIGTEIESPGIPVIPKLAAGKVNFSHTERTTLAKLIALQSVRVPFERNFMDSNHRENLLSYLSDMDEESRRLGGPVNALEVSVAPRDDPRLIQKWVTLRRADVLEMLKELEEDPGRTSRETFFGLADHLAEILVGMEWTVYYASGKSRFITSDRPVIVDSADEDGLSRGLKDMRTTVTFPLSGTALLQLKHRNWLVEAVRKRSCNEPARRRKPANPVIAVLPADDAFVDILNTLQANHAHLWVFSGCGQIWLSDWAQAPLKEPKQAAKVLDTEENISTHGQPARRTRKREFVVSHR
jgi:hypothetical protein